MKFDDIPAITDYSTDDAVQEGVLIDLTPKSTILPIDQIESMDGYLQNYGGTLGRKAIDALAPLHVPGRDPLPGFDDLLREPFPCQQHVIAASVKMMDKVGSGFIVGEMGCIAGESEVYDPVAGLYRRVDQITEPFHVVSHHNGNAVIGKAHVPFIKGTRDLYRVTLSDSQTFVATDHHRILTDQGWQLVSEVAERLRVSGHVPLPSIQEPSPSVSQQGAERSSRTPSGSQGDCLTGHRSYGEQPRSASGVAQESVQQQGDVPERSRCCSQQDAQADEAGRIHACRSSVLRSTTRSEHLPGCTSPSDASQLPLSLVPCGQGEDRVQDDPRSLGASIPPDTTGSSVQSASQSGCASPLSCLGEFVGELVHVTQVVFQRTDVYYDFTVDEFHNYVMVGVVHHNTGKTLLGMTAVHKHAQRSRRKGGSGGKYRAIVLCPDHLIAKWVREIEETIPDATVIRFGPQGDEKVVIKKARRKKGEKNAVAPETNSRATLKDVVRLFSRGEESLKDIQGDDSRRAPEDHSVSTGTDTFDDVAATLPGSSGKVVQRRRRWAKPQGPEWHILGRNQAKWLSDWAGIADGDGSVSRKQIVVDHEIVVNEHGYPCYDKRGNPVRKAITGESYYCPSCGNPVRDKKGNLISKKQLTSQSSVDQKVCRGTYMQMVPSGPEKPSHGLDRMSPVPSRFREKKPGGDPFNHGGFQWVIRECKEPLYSYTSSPYRWAPARIVQKQLRGMFKYLVIDEVHEQKSDESAQSMACGKLIGAVRHVLALTGTIIGGYAHHLFPLMIRLTPQTLKDEGFEWGKAMPFSEAYGRIDQVVTTTEEGCNSVRGNTKSMRRAKSGNRSVEKYVRPGVMPTLFGRHMIGSSLFITLEEMSDELPDLIEYVGGACPPPPQDEADMEHYAKVKDGWFDVACDMKPEQKAEYNRVMATLEFANRELLKKGSMKLLGTYLWTGLDYPDRPFGWDHDAEVKKAYALAQKEALADPEAAVPKPGHTVGYWNEPKIRTIDNFVGVVTPASLPEDVIYPKEQRLIDICLKQKADGTQTWVYVQMSGKRNVQPRLKSLLEAVGLKVGILRADDVEPIDRENWIAAHGRDYDVMISHPQLVSTGLDLFSKNQGGHNYSTLVFYETGYNLFTMRQAARRAWRIGQPRDCRVYYLYYKDTMQHKAMALMSRKMAAAQALEGEFSEDGLAAMAGEDNLQMALAKNLSERIDDSDMQRTWSKVKSGPKKPFKKPTAAIAEMTPTPVVPGPLDGLPIELQIVASTMAENRPAPPEAQAEFAAITAMLRDIDDRFNILVANGEFGETDDAKEEDVVWSPLEPASGPEENQGTDEWNDDDDWEVPELSESQMAAMFAAMNAEDDGWDDEDGD